MRIFLDSLDSTLTMKLDLESPPTSLGELTYLFDSILYKLKIEDLSSLDFSSRNKLIALAKQLIRSTELTLNSVQAILSDYGLIDLESSLNYYTQAKFEGRELSSKEKRNLICTLEYLGKNVRNKSIVENYQALLGSLLKEPQEIVEA